MIRRITQKPWFGPKHSVGWGWRVSSWQGAVVLIIFLLSMFCVIGFARSTLIGALGPIVLSGLFILITFLTGDPPGGTNFNTQL